MNNYDRRSHSGRAGYALVIAAIAAVFAAYWFWPQLQSLINPSDRTGPPQVTIGTFSKALGNAPYYVARHFKWFESQPALQGAAIKYVEYNDRPAIASAFSQGQLDLLFSAEIPSILIRAQGEDTRIVLVSTYAAQEILVPSNSAVRDVSDLKGKRIAVQSGTSSHFCLFRILDAAGLKPSDVSIAYMPAAEARSAFESGGLDAWAVWAPWVETQQVTGRGRTLAGGNALVYSVGTIRKAFLENQSERAQALADAIRKAKTWMAEHPAEAQEIVAQELGFDVAVVRRAWPKFEWGAQLTDQAVMDFQKKAQFLADQGLSRDGVVVNVAKDLVDLRLQSRAPQ